MRTEEPRLIQLKDYRPPDWLIETVELEVSLDPTATRVRARLKVKPNGGNTPAPLVLDGEDLKLRSLALDGKPLPSGSFTATPERLTIAQPPNRPFELEIENVIDRRPIRSSWASTGPAPLIARSAKRKDSAASRISSIGRM